MTERQRKALDRRIEIAQERTRRNWNRMVRQEEAEYRKAEEQASQRRSELHVVKGEA